MLTQVIVKVIINYKIKIEQISLKVLKSWELKLLLFLFLNKHKIRTADNKIYIYY